MNEIQYLAEEIDNCRKCSLGFERTNTVPGEGPYSASIVFIGEAPGHNEDLQGKPFVGAAGRLLDDLLSQVGFERQDVFITNILKCRPPNNRDPLPAEIKACTPFLEKQLQKIQPNIIVTLGRFSLSYFFPTLQIGKVRGKLLKWNNQNIYPVYHPAAALRNTKFYDLLKNDFQQMVQFLEEKPVEESPITDNPESIQLSFFDD